MKRCGNFPIVFFKKKTKTELEITKIPPIDVSWSRFCRLEVCRVRMVHIGLDVPSLHLSMERANM